MERSEGIAQLAGALAKAQAEIEGASKDSTNPHFKSKYADLASVWDACRKPLSKYGLSVVQLPRAEGANVTVTTLLLHNSGEFIGETLTVQAQDGKPQSVGSALTYCRRYGLSTVVGIAPEDDDGEAAQGRASVRTVEPRATPQPVSPAGYQDWLTDLRAAASDGPHGITEAWAESRPEFRQWAQKYDAMELAAIKAGARSVAGVK